MDIIQQIGFQAIEILTLVFGILGMTFSLMLLFSPGLALSLSNILNRSIDLENKLDVLDKVIELSGFFYYHHALIGVLMSAGSLFALSFFFFKLDVSRLASIFFDPGQAQFFGEIFLQAIVWIARVGCFLGLVFGLMLLLAPGRMKRIEKKLNSWFETKPMVSKLDISSNQLDTFLFRHPLIVGLIGAMLSLFLILLSIGNLLR